MYWKYFKYVVEHKWNVGIECVKMGMILHAITHDLSKFLPSEFIPYAKKFMSPKLNENSKEKKEIEKEFTKAWGFHQKRNKHHWNYWICNNKKSIPIPMPEKYVKQMMADWHGMGRKFKSNAQTFYMNNRDKMLVHDETTLLIQKYLFSEE